MNSQPEKILIRGVNWLGDAVMTTPALQRLREARPDAQITILTHEKLSDLWRNQPFIDDVIALTSNESVFQIGRRLRWGNFDIGLAFPNSPRSAFELWYGKIPRRIGYARAWRNLLLTQRIAPRPGEIKMRKRSVAEINERVARNAAPESFPSSAHHVHQYLHLVSAAFGANPEPLPPRIFVAGTAVQLVSEKFALASGAVWCGLNPGAEYGPAKRWPKERFISAAVELHRNSKCRWIVFGGKSDVTLCEEITAAIRQITCDPDAALSLAGKTSLRELCATMKLCRVVLTNDTGPMHVAAAVGTPVVVPFGSTSPDLTGPGFFESSRHKFLGSDAPCSPCFLRECPIDFRCMNGVDVKGVVNAVSEILSSY